MKANSISLHASVGLFLLIGLACTAYLSLTLANTAFLSGGHYTLTARFAAVNGLRPGSNVEISGVHVGKVTDISLEPELFQAVVTMRVRDTVPVPSDSTAAIKTSGLIGDRYISIIPGGDDSTLEDRGVILDTQPAVDIEELISKYVFGSVTK